MDSDEFSKASIELSRWIADYWKTSEQYPVLSRVKPGDIRKAIPAHPPAHPETFESVMQDFSRIILPGVTHWNHPAFYAYFAITGSPPGILADMLSTALNINGMLWKSSPAATELEQAVLDWLRQMLGLPEGWFGVIMDTASVGSLCAMAAARESLARGIREKGMAGRSDLPPLCIYTSAQSHSSIEKGAIVLGFGQENVRKVEVDSEFRMRPEALEGMIVNDVQNGYLPACVVATVGTTSTSSVDPVPAIADICARHGIWLHVDAAYAGSAAILPEMRWILDGCEHADSFLVNPHKWMFVPFDCTAFYTRRPEILSGAFSLVPEYLRTGEEGITNYMDYGIQLGRRFRALKLWFVIRMYGVEGLQQAIRNHIEMAREFADWVRNSESFELMAPAPFSLVCFRARPKGCEPSQLDALNMNLMDAVNRTGEAFLSHTKLNNAVTLRLAIGNMKTERRHIKRAQELLQQQLAQLLG
jgi:aromatic-L-amino-acid/L-tryptophan decarboxylase